MSQNGQDQGGGAAPGDPLDNLLSTPATNNVPGNPYWDHLNAGLGPNVPAEDNPAGPWNIDDPNWYIKGDPEAPTGTNTKYWDTTALHLTDLPQITEPPKDCFDKCKDMEANRRKKCTILRKRVAAALKGAGCPSKVTPYSTTATTCSRTPKKKAPAKKKTTAKKK